MLKRRPRILALLAVIAATTVTSLTMAGTARADVNPPTVGWAEIFAPEINSSGITLCADNRSSLAQGNNLILWRCHGYASNGAPQRWVFEFEDRRDSAGNLEWKVASIDSGLCIGLDPSRVAAGTISGSNLLQESCINPFTDWALVPATLSPDPNNQFILQNSFSTYAGGPWVMEANTFLDQNGNRLIAEPRSDANSAQWFALG
jgi:hypothetical protein